MDVEQTGMLLYCAGVFVAMILYFISDMTNRP